MKREELRSRETLLLLAFQGVSLAPHAFTKFVEVALSPLRERGILILHYLDDRALIVSHREPVERALGAPSDSGFSVYMQKRSLTLS